MKLVTFTHEGRTRLGAVVSDALVDFAAHGGDLPEDMVGFLAGGEDALAAAREACASGKGRLLLGDVSLEAPIPRPPKILAVGLNYKDHVAEGGFEVPTVPVIFNKQSTAVTGPQGVIHRPKESVELDYEGEFAFVIGKRCRRVPKERALGVIGGYTIANDVSVRDWQFRSPTTTMGKSWDTHCPLGPYLVTPDEVGDPHDLALRTWVNGELRQDSNTSNLILTALTSSFIFPPPSRWNRGMWFVPVRPAALSWAWIQRYG